MCIIAKYYKYARTLSLQFAHIFDVHDCAIARSTDLQINIALHTSRSTSQHHQNTATDKMDKATQAAFDLLSSEAKGTRVSKCKCWPVQ